MGTIQARKRKDGSMAYTAQVRIKKGSKVIHHEAGTFERKRDAVAWMREREHDLSKHGVEKAQDAENPPLSTVIYRYMDEYEAIRPLGRTKRQSLRRIAQGPFGKLRVSDVTSEALVAFAKERVRQAQPQTVSNDMAHLSAVFSVARPAWGYRLDYEAIRQAKAVCKKMGLTRASRERDRRPTLDELDKLMGFFMERQQRRPTAVNMPKVIAFAIFSTRRQEEITRIMWDDVNGEFVTVRNLKHPGEKMGNDVACRLTPEAYAIIQSMPRAKDRIFPYSTDAIGAAFTRACKMLGIEGLRFHDLRHDGVSRLFEMGHDIPHVASVSAHRDWNSLRRYTHMREGGDKYEGWPWLERVIGLPVKLGKNSINGTGALRSLRQDSGARPRTEHTGRRSPLR